MANMRLVPSPTASITIPAKYLKDARKAAVAEIADTSAVFKTSDDSRSSALILGRELQLLDTLLEAIGEVELTAESDTVSSPIADVLQTLVRQLLERLGAVAEYGPLPLGDVLEVIDEMRWAAEQAIRIEPHLATTLTVKDGEAA